MSYGVKRFPQSEKGFSLVELMVALVLGLLVVAAVLQGYVALKRAFTQVDSITERQNKIRFLSDTISLDIRTSSPYVSGVNFIKIDPSLSSGSADLNDCSGSSAMVDGAAVASGASKILHIPYSKTRPDDPYCVGTAADLRQVRYFSVSGKGLYMCYICADPASPDDASLWDESPLYPVDKEVDATFGLVGDNAIEVSLVFPDNEGVDVDGAAASERKYIFSSVSRDYVVQRLEQAVD